jgi:hypothetical protein
VNRLRFTSARNVSLKHGYFDESWSCHTLLSVRSITFVSSSSANVGYRCVSFIDSLSYLFALAADRIGLNYLGLKPLLLIWQESRNS